MSIVAYYGRVSEDQLAACIADPQKLASGSVADLPGAEVVDIDRAWEPLAWLVSPRKRIEQEHNALVLEQLVQQVRSPKKPSLGSRIAKVFRGKPKPKAKQHAAREIESPLDLPLVAIEGRTEARVERLDFGMGAAAVFDPKQVADLSAALGAVTVQAIEQTYKPELMDEMRVFPEYWVEEGRELLDNYILANLKKLQNFYSAAAASRQLVVIWYI